MNTEQNEQWLATSKARSPSKQTTKCRTEKKLTCLTIWFSVKKIRRRLREWNLTRHRHLVKMLYNYHREFGSCLLRLFSAQKLHDSTVLRWRVVVVVVGVVIVIVVVVAPSYLREGVQLRTIQTATKTFLFGIGWLQRIVTVLMCALEILLDKIMIRYLLQCNQRLKWYKTVILGCVRFNVPLDTF